MASLDFEFTDRAVRFTATAAVPVICILRLFHSQSAWRAVSRVGHVAHADTDHPTLWVSPNHYDWLTDDADRIDLRNSAVRWWRGLNSEDRC